MVLLTMMAPCWYDNSGLIELCDLLPLSRPLTLAASSVCTALLSGLKYLTQLNRELGLRVGLWWACVIHPRMLQGVCRVSLVTFSLYFCQHYLNGGSVIRAQLYHITGLQLFSMLLFLPCRQYYWSCIVFHHVLCSNASWFSSVYNACLLQYPPRLFSGHLLQETFLDFFRYRFFSWSRNI